MTQTTEEKGAGFGPSVEELMAGQQVEAKSVITCMTVALLLGGVAAAVVIDIVSRHPEWVEKTMGLFR